MGKKEEFCIMPEHYLYETKRRPGLHRHEVFFGTANRQKSIKLGLVVFLKPELHNASPDGVHFNRALNFELKRIGQRAAMRYYKWSVEDFIREFGRNYL